MREPSITNSVILSILSKTKQTGYNRIYKIDRMRNGGNFYH